MNCISKWCQVSENISCKQLLNDMGNASDLYLSLSAVIPLSWRTLYLWFNQLSVDTYDLKHTVREWENLFTLLRYDGLVGFTRVDLHTDSS